MDWAIPQGGAGSVPFCVVRRPQIHLILMNIGWISQLVSQAPSVHLHLSPCSGYLYMVFTLSPTKRLLSVWHWSPWLFMHMTSFLGKISPTSQWGFQIFSRPSILSFLKLHSASTLYALLTWWWVPLYYDGVYLHGCMLSNLWMSCSALIMSMRSPR